MAMPRRKTYEEVRRLFEEYGYKLVSTEYLNNKQKLDYVCPNGHNGRITYSDFKTGYRCSSCSGNKRLTYDEVKAVFEEAGYELLSTEYVRSTSKLAYRCPDGHEGSMTYSNFYQGKRCPVCAKKACNDKRRLPYDEVKRAFENRGYRLLSTTYTSNNDVLEYICPKGHRGRIRYKHFSSGHGCRECAADSTRLGYDKVKEAFNDRGYTLLSTEYFNISHKLEYVCPNGHRGRISYGSFKQGQGCGVCADTRLAYDDVRRTFEEAGYTLVSAEYVNSKEYLKYICPKGHKGSISYTNFKQGKRCPACVGPVSKAELEIRDYVISLIGEENVVSNSRSVIPPMELDIFVPAKKLAIEYCGLYWHSEVAGGKPRDYHRAKMDACAEKGIRLITVFEDEYLNKSDVVKSRLLSAMGLIKRRVYARKCEVRPIDAKASSSFLDAYHLQGNSPRTHGWGLFYGDELLQVLTVGKVSRAHASKVNGKLVSMYELKRFATVPYTIVVGGASKLFKTATSFLRANGGEYIKSYSDNRYANIFHSVYDELGFELTSETKYTPHYVMGTTRYRNQALRKTKDERLLGRTEWELRREQGYDRIWDCGHKTYLFTL